MLKEIQKEVENLRIKVYAGESLEDTEKALCEIEQMLFKAMNKQCNIPVVSSMFSAEQMEKAFNDGVEAEQKRCGEFDIENYC